MSIPSPNPWTICCPQPRCATRCVSLRIYFHNLGGQAPSHLYELVLSEVEAPLLETVMALVGGNQTRAAAILGLNRGTLRKKLRQHGFLDQADRA